LKRRTVSREFEVLLLVLAHRDPVGAVEDDVRGLQHRVGEQPGVHVVGLVLALVLELRHTVQVAQRRQAREHPGELGVLRHVGLHEHRGALRIHARREHSDRHFADGAPQRVGIRTLRQRVEVHDAEERLVLLLQPDPVDQGAEVVADVQVSGRLDAGHDARHGLGI
jgi:hypothetical protein